MPSASPEGMIATMVVDDHVLVRRGFRRMLEDDPGITVVGEAGDGPEAVDLAVSLRPAVIVMDYAMPSMNGANAARKIRAAVPEAAILILSMHSEPACVRNCMDAGVRGYLLKNAMDLELVAAVKTLAAGGTVVDPRLEMATGPPTALSTRELEVLQLIVNGKSNKDIGVILAISANT